MSKLINFNKFIFNNFKFFLKLHIFHNILYNSYYKTPLVQNKISCIKIYIVFIYLINILEIYKLS